MRFLLLLVALPACSNDTFSSGDASSADAADAGSDCGVSFCSTRQDASFCGDFDETLYTQGFSVDTNNEGPTLSSTQSTFTSCPNALTIDVPQITTAPNIGSEPHAWVIASAGVASSVTVDFDVLLPTIPKAPPLPDGGFNAVDGFAFFSLHEADATWNVRLERSADGGWFLRVHQGTSGASPSAPVNNLLVGQWNHMTLTVKFSNDPLSGSASLAYQATTTTSMPVTIGPIATLPSSGIPSTVSFLAGALVLDVTTQAYVIDYDSIVLNAQK